MFLLFIADARACLRCIRQAPEEVPGQQPDLITGGRSPRS